MAGNSFGTLFRITTFGESHGPALGVIIDGCPAGLKVTSEDIQKDLDRRKPSHRQEVDQVEILSGIFEDKTLGTPIALIIKNKDAKSEDYEHLKDVHRPGHADETYDKKYGHRDHRGGGRASARETAARVAAGAVAKLLIPDVKIEAKTLNPVAPEKNDSVGGVIQITANGVPAGLGEPVFNKLSADLAKALMSIPAAKGFEFGEGFAAAELKGSEMKHTGGIAGGISNGEEIILRLALKPPSSIPNRTGGRHDQSIAHRAIPIAEAMTALVLADHFLLNKNAKL